MTWHVDFRDRSDAYGGFVTASTTEERDSATADLKSLGLRVVWTPTRASE